MGRGGHVCGAAVIVLCAAASCSFDPSVAAGGETDAIDSGVNVGNPDGSSALFDAGLRPPPAPAATSFVDDFGDDSIGSEWDVFQSASGCTVVETGSRIQFSVDGSSASRCTVTSTAKFDLLGEHVAIEVPPINTYHPEMSVFLAVEDPGVGRVVFGFENGVFFGAATAGQSVVYNATSVYLPAPGHWRIREQAGTIYLESSSNRTTWATEMQLPSPFAVTHIHPSFGVATTGPMAGSVGIQVPGFNTQP